jgi:hypothetical protein
LNEYYAKSIIRDFSEFEEYQDQAVDAILDLCEDENEQVGPYLYSLSSLIQFLFLGQVIHMRELRGIELIWRDVILTLIREENADPRHV